MTKVIETDELDHQILTLLHTDARMPSSRMANQLEVTDRTVRNRIEKILASGLAKIGLLADQESAGYPVIALIHIDTEAGMADQVARIGRRSYDQLCRYLPT